MGHCVWKIVCRGKVLYMIGVFVRSLNSGELSTKLAKEFVKKVKVYSKEDIRVELNYYDEFAEYKAYCEEREMEGLILLTKVM